MANKQVNIIQLTKPIDRFKEFDVRLDGVLRTLDQLGELYTDLGFRQKDIEEYTAQESDALREELREHGQLVLGLLHHPLIEVLREKREMAQSEEPPELYDVPSGIWQHYKGVRYEILDYVLSSDFHAPAIIYREENKPVSRCYTITLSNFYRKVNFKGEVVNRFTKVA